MTYTVAVRPVTSSTDRPARDRGIHRAAFRQSDLNDGHLRRNIRRILGQSVAASPKTVNVVTTRLSTMLDARVVVSSVVSDPYPLNVVMPTFLAHNTHRVILNEVKNLLRVCEALGILGHSLSTLVVDSSLRSE